MVERWTYTRWEAFGPVDAERMGHGEALPWIRPPHAKTTVLSSPYIDEVYIGESSTINVANDVVRAGQNGPTWQIAPLFSTFPFAPWRVENRKNSRELSLCTRRTVGATSLHSEKPRLTESRASAILRLSVGVVRCE